MKPTKYTFILLILTALFAVAFSKFDAMLSPRDHLNFENKSDLLAFVPIDGQAFTLLGETVKGDSPIRFYYYSTASTATDDGETVIKPTSVSGAGRYLKVFYDQFQSDWNQSTSTEFDYINNKPTIPTNNNQLTNGAGYITGINSSMVTSALGYTPLQTEVDGSVINEIELPSMSGQSGKILSNNGSSCSWITDNTGTVTSIGVSMPSGFSVSGSPITTSGTISITGAGTTSQYLRGDGTLASLPGNSNASAYASGTVYTLTTTSQKVDFGTNDPVVTIPASGTYLIYTNIRLGYNAATLALSNRTITFKLRRTNNTASDLTNSSTAFVVPLIGTSLTGTAGDCDVPAILYTTSNNNDLIELWGDISSALTTGTAQVQEASIVAIKIY